MRALPPRLLCCTLTGFDPTGPLWHRADSDFLIQGVGGLVGVPGRGDDQPCAGPMKVGVALTDIMTGLYASTAILAALQAGHSTGRSPAD